MPYAPTVNDNSGQIMGGYITDSAQIKAAGNEALAQGIMDGITTIATLYASDKMQKAGGKAFKDFMGMAGPSMGLKDEDLQAFKGMSDYDAYQFSQSFLPVAPSMISATGLGNYNNRLALANQQAANQAAARQPAANQTVPNQPAAIDMQGWAAGLRGNP